MYVCENTSRYYHMTQSTCMKITLKAQNILNKRLTSNHYSAIFVYLLLLFIYFILFIQGSPISYKAGLPGSPLGAPSGAPSGALTKLGIQDNVLSLLLLDTIFI